MELCRNCNIEDKIEECCGAYPDTDRGTKVTKRARLKDGSVLEACTFLDRTGACAIYDELPEEGPCRRSECPKSYEYDLVELREMREKQRTRW